LEKRASEDMGALLNIMYDVKLNYTSSEVKASRIDRFSATEGASSLGFFLTC